MEDEPGKSVKRRRGRATVTGDDRSPPSKEDGATAGHCAGGKAGRASLAPREHGRPCVRDRGPRSQETDLTGIAQSFAPRGESNAALAPAVAPSLCNQR